MKAGTLFKQYSCQVDIENNLFYFKDEKISFYQILDIAPGEQQVKNLVIGFLGFIIFFLTGIGFIREGDYISGILTLLIAYGVGIFLFFILKTRQGFKAVYKMMLKNNRIIFIFAENEDEKSNIENIAIKVQELNATSKAEKQQQ